MSATQKCNALHLLSASKTKTQLIAECFLHVTRFTEYWNRWLPVDQWIDIIKERCTIPDDIVITQRSFKLALNKHPRLGSTLQDFERGNESGVYREEYRPRIINSNGNARAGPRITCYYVTKPRSKVKQPDKKQEWWRNMDSTKPKALITRNICNSIENESDAQKLNEEIVREVREQKKRKADEIATTAEHSDLPNLPAAEPVVEEQNEPEQNPRIVELLSQTYWDSPEACKLFGADEEQNALMNIRRRIETLSLGFSTATGWRHVLNDEDKQDVCSEFDRFNIRSKCQYISVALKFAERKMPMWTWKKCCSEAVKAMEIVGLDLIRNGETLRKWHLLFRDNNDCFPNPARHRHDGRSPLPMLLENNPDLKNALVRYCKEHLDHLTAELITSYLYETALPALLEERRRELVSNDFTLEQLLQENRLTKIAVSTIYRWMERLGFKYEPRKKCYYVDGHEKPETIIYRRNFCQRYIKHELRMFRWIQIPSERANLLVKERKISESIGHHYVDNNGVDMVEYHVDDSPVFEEVASQNTRFGGYLSVRKPEGSKPLICLGQDEYIFKQFTFTTKSWTAPDGQKALVPKDDGMGIMISAFVSREFGYGLKLSQEDILKINQLRRGNDKHYSDEEAAKLVTGKSCKPILTKSPFVLEFEYGAAQQGYWKYDHMAVQMEDCVDCLVTLYPEYDFLFLFDHSCGHDRQRPDGLNAQRVNKSFGGGVPKMRNTTIESKDYLDPYKPTMLAIGDVQSMVFTDNDDGPFYMTETERIASEHDRVTGQIRKRKRRKDELLNHLKGMGIVATGNREQLAKIANDNNIPVEVEYQQTIEGWSDKPKGMLQILYERGFIDSSNLSAYTVNGQRDVYGNVMQGTSLRQLLMKQSDFVEEETLLQYHGRLLGIEVDRTPKCHPELAGEGIEYAWGCAKNAYRRMPLSEKKRKDKFRQSVRRAMCRDTVLTTERMRKFGRRARQYITA